MKKIVLILAVFGLIILIAVGYLTQKEYEPDNQIKLKELYSKKSKPKVGHLKICCTSAKIQ